MKKILIPLLLLSIILTWCGNNKATFEQKQQCANYKDKIIKEIEENFRFPLYEIFYSPKIQSCVYVTMSVTDFWDVCKQVVDYISNKEIENLCYNPKLCPDDIVCKTMEWKIKELKWE